MNRRTFAYAGSLVIAGTAIPTALLHAADDGTIGRMSADDFKKMNMQGGKKVKALKPTATTLSEDDAKLMAMIAAGGMMQLQASQMAAQNATSKDVRTIAAAEVEEQTILSAKLKELAQAKNVALPDQAHKKTAKLLSTLQGKTGSEFDRAYIDQSGVEGHEMLRETMMKVQSKAADPDLKALAVTALPLIETHLQVSRDEMAGMS